jgi:sialate O-acetylesterase
MALFSTYVYSQSPFFETMQGFPDAEPGISLGVSACFSGIINNNLVIVGGCNFPEKSASKGGEKRFYKGIYISALETSNQLNWTKIAELPQTLAYGLSIVQGNSLILVGGSNEKSSQSSVYRLTFDDKILAKIDTLPSLPFKIDNMSGALLRNRIYVVGGYVNSKPSNTVFSLNLSAVGDGWNQELSFPGPPRIQPVVVAQNDNLFLWAGFSPSVNGFEAIVSTDGYMYSLHTSSWTPLVSPLNKKQEAVALGGGVGVALDDHSILFTGGVNKDIFLRALNAGLKYTARRHARFTARYLTRKPRWYRFNKTLFIYNTKTKDWTLFDENESMARAGASLLKSKQYIYLINGEIKPGIRTPEITRMKLSCFYK